MKILSTACAACRGRSRQRLPKGEPTNGRGSATVAAGKGKLWMAEGRSHGGGSDGGVCESVAGDTSIYHDCLEFARWACSTAVVQDSSKSAFARKRAKWTG